MNKDIHYIKRCIELAALALGNTHPNPLVGAVIVHNDIIIGESYHKEYGKAHAEVNAINSVQNKELLKESCLYVSLEPCCHHGKTPPCTDLIIKNKIPKVVIAATDPNPKVAGKGIQILINAGIEVISGLCKEEANELNKRFNTFHQKKRPYIILKWAETKDGFIDKADRTSEPHINWISNSQSRQLVHKWRAEEQAILIGKNTAKNDNPSLTTREWPGKNPIRILIDPELEAKQDLILLNDEYKTIVIHDQKIKPQNCNLQNKIFKSIDFSSDTINQIMDVLYSENIVSVIIEGGKNTLENFIQSELWDEARVIIGNIKFENGLKAPKININPITKTNFGNDILKIYINKR